MRLYRLILALSILALFAIATVFGLYMSMTTDSHGNMGTCPFMQGAASICQMNIMEHIKGWQSAFTTTVPGVIVLLIAFVFLLGPRFNFKDTDFVKARYFYKCRNSLSTVFDYLRIALSRGILHSKIFDFSFILG